VILADLVLADFAVMVTLVALVTAPVLIVKLTLLVPVGMKTDAGTEAILLLLLDKVTVTPPAGAGLAAVTIPCDVVPLTGALDFIASELSSIAVAETVLGANSHIPPSTRNIINWHPLI
jgi:hypothetical protein